MSLNLEKDICDKVRDKGWPAMVMSSDLQYIEATQDKEVMVFITSTNHQQGSIGISNKTDLLEEYYCDVVLVIMGKTIESVAQVEDSIRTLTQESGANGFGFDSIRLNMTVYYEGISSQFFSLSEQLRKALRFDNARMLVMKLRYL